MDAQEVAPKYEEELLSCVHDWALEQIIQRGCGVSLIGDTQKLSRWYPVPCALELPCLSWDVGPDDPPWALPPWTILGFCDFSPHQNVAAKWSINIKIYSIRESQGSNCQMLIAPPSHNFTISEGKTQVVGGDWSVVGVKTSLGIHRGQYKRLLGK